jgi:hypothetical protein
MAKTKCDDPPASYVFLAKDGTVNYVGELATRLFQAGSLRAALSAPLGPFSTRRLLVVAQAFTGRSYAESGRLQAMSDLDDWIRNMELIVPILEES